MVMRSLVQRNAHSAFGVLLVSPPFQFQRAPRTAEMLYTQRALNSSPVAVWPVGKLHRSRNRSKTHQLNNTYLGSIQISYQMDLKGGGGGGSIKSDKKRGPVTALLSRQNSKTGRGSTPVSNSDQDSPPVVPDTIDSPLLGRANNNGAGNSISRTSSIRSKQGEPSADRNTSPMPKSRDQTPESGDSIQSTGDSSSLGNKVTGKRLIDSAKKKILWLASKNEWGGLEQAMKTLEQTVAANKNSTELLSPLADIQDEVYF